MQKPKAILTISIILLILPFTGFPSQWKIYIAFVCGIWLFILWLSKFIKDRVSRGTVGETPSENTFRNDSTHESGV